MTNKFCGYLSNCARVEYGKLRPCCWFEKSVDVTDSTKVREFQQYIESIEDWKDTRGNCRECFIREQNGLESPRLESFRRKEIQTATGNEKTIIEIQIDRDCNGACLICGPWNSTTWEKYDHKINNIPFSTITKSTVATNNFITQISQSIDFSNAQTVLFLGGEPLKSDSHLEMLELISDPSSTRLSYTTNGSFLPNNKTIAAWQKFNEVRLHFSIDGIGPHFDYLRWPLKWEQVEGNIKSILSLSDSNIKVTPFSYTVTPFSLYYHDRYVNWASSIFNSGEIMFNMPWRPRGENISLAATPIELQDVIRKKYGNDHCISKILEPYDTNSYKTFMSYIKQHDSIRHVNWREVFPEIEKYFT